MTETAGGTRWWLSMKRLAETPQRTSPTQPAPNRLRNIGHVMWSHRAIPFQEGPDCCENSKREEGEVTMKRGLCFSYHAVG